MNSEERDLIGGLFDRMRGMDPPQKDREADAFIQQGMRQTPNAAYMLVQSVLVQEHALQQADARIQELEARVQELEDQAQTRQSTSSGGGGFLGGIFGSGRPSQPAPQSTGRTGSSYGSVPPIGGRSQPAGYDQSPPPGPWGQTAQQGGGFGQGGYAAQQPASAPAQQRSGGGFLKSAMATAAGVAGGMILADSLKGMLGGGHANASTPASTSSDGGFLGSDSNSSWGNSTPVDDNDPGGTYEQAADDNDPGGSWDAGDSGDIEI